MRGPSMTPGRLLRIPLFIVLLAPYVQDEARRGQCVRVESTMAARKLPAAVRAVLPECVGLRVAVFALNHYCLPPMIAVLGGRERVPAFLHYQHTTGSAE
jgi:hypothetical protein